MPVCLTGDVHHDSLGTADQAALDGTELAATVEYVDIVENHDLAATLFVTGRSAVERPDDVERFGRNERIEVGGHNYAAFTVPGVPHSGKLFSVHRRLRGTNCPRFVQARSIRKTVSRLSETTGAPVVSWRDHGFNRDKHTYDLLARSGLQFVSDERDPERTGPFRVSTGGGDLVEVPINTPPDHDHVEHGTVTLPEGWSDPFSADQYDGPEWRRRVCSAVERIDEAGGVATVLAHPACMALVDSFAEFERLCADLSNYKTLTVAEAGRRLK